MWWAVAVLLAILDLGLGWAATEEGAARGPLMYPMLLFVAATHCVLVPIGLWLAPRVVDELGRPARPFGKARLLVLVLGVPPIIWASIFYLQEASY